MKFILAANILENNEFGNFMESALVEYPDAGFIVLGDLLNNFPEASENLPDSMFCELYGQLALEETGKLFQNKFKKFKESTVAMSLKGMFLPLGSFYQKAQLMAHRRYERLFSQMEAILGHNNLYFVPGDMDYPGIAECVVHMSSSISSLDFRVVTVDDVKIAGLGGVPENARPFGKVIELTPNEMAAGEFKRRLQRLWGVDVLVTHIAPMESAEFMEFVKKSPVKLVICTAPANDEFDVTNIKGKHLIKVQTFNPNANQGIVIELAKGTFDPKSVNIFEYNAVGV